MSSINYDLTKIKAFLFDVDGVLSSDISSLSPDGVPIRTMNIKDGYAMQLAIKQGFEVGIITGAFVQNLRIRFERLGISHIYMKSCVKIVDYNDFIAKTGLKDHEIVFAGDDIPDIEVLRRVGLPIAPATAAPEVKEVAKYVSSIRGGEGIAREIIEQTMKAQDKWMNGEAFGW